MNRHWLRTISCTVLGVAALVLAACGGAQAQRQGELAELGRLLPGVYDNLEQVGGRGADQDTSLPALRVAIVPIYAPLVGKDIFYLQEMAADDPRRVTAQRILSLEVTVKGELLQGLFALAEPNRWRDGHERIDLFKSLLPNDLRLAEGCDVAWRRSGKGFEGSNTPATCRVNRRTSGDIVRQESRVELDADGIAFADTFIDSAGVREPASPRWYRFRRRAN
jgi:hypothetical protein